LTSYGGVKVDATVRGDTHCKYEGEDVKPNGSICEPAIIAQGLDLADQEADGSPDDTESGEADSIFGYLG